MARTVLDEFITIFRFEVAGTNRVHKELSTIDAHVNKTVAAMGRGVLMWGMAFGFAGRGVTNLEKRIIGMSTQARISTDDMWNHYHALREVGKQYNVTGTAMLDAMNEVVELTGKADLAMRNSDLIAMMIRGGRMKPVDVGSLVAAFHDLKIPAEEFSQLTDSLVHISKLGSIPIHKIGSIMPRALGLYSATGVKDMKQAAIDVAAAMQIGNRLMRSPRRAVTAFENFVNDFSDKVDEINAITGSSFSGNEGLVTIMGTLVKHFADLGDMKGLSDVLGVDKSELRSTENILTTANEIFGRRGIRQFAAGVLGFRDMEDLIRSADEAVGTLARDTDEYANTTVGQLEQMKIALEGIVAKFTESGGMLAVFNAAVRIIGSFAWLIGKLPDGLIEVILLSLLWQKVIMGLLVASLRPMVLMIAHNLIPLIRTLGLTFKSTLPFMQAFRQSAAALNFTMAANPITAIIMAVLNLIPLLITAWYWIKKLFTGKGNLDVGGIDLTKANPYNLASPTGNISTSTAHSVLHQTNHLTVEGNVDTDERVEDISDAMKAEVASAADYLSGLSYA